MSQSNADTIELTALRRALHQHPELSGEERETALAVVNELRNWPPDETLTGLGGHGVAAIYDSGHPGPTVMIRAELDALPIHETSALPHASQTPGKGHLCGHDGHTAILLGLARILSRGRPAMGRAVLLFQPAEENGAGAAAVIADPRFERIAPDWGLSLHNMPGVPLGRAWLAPGIANCASVGLKILLEGATAHASTPETGRAPTTALARLIDALHDLAPGGATKDSFRLATVTHLRMGEPAFGIAPGAGELWVTLRTLTDDALAMLLEQVQALATTEAETGGLSVRFEQHDPFTACFNHPEATEILARALDATGIAHDAGDQPMRASEDFGRFGTAGAKSAMLFLGAGLDQPALHSQTYDFPDDLIPVGLSVFHHAIRELLG